MKRDNQFSHIPEINEIAQRLYTTAAGADRTDYGIPVENFAYHVGEIMSQPAPTTFTLHFRGQSRKSDGQRGSRHIPGLPSVGG
jgi:hypothetical protein